jgi:polyisoprenyl-phosphate glycosyltransferase
MIKLASDAMIAYSDKPLRITIKLGILISFVAFLFGLYYLTYTLIHGQSIAGWTSLIVSLYFLSGIIISILGMIGIYIGKIFDETKNRPLYLIANKTEKT